MRGDSRDREKKTLDVCRYFVHVCVYVHVQTSLSMCVSVCNLWDCSRDKQALYKKLFLFFTEDFKKFFCNKFCADICS